MDDVWPVGMEHESEGSFLQMAIWFDDWKDVEPEEPPAWDLNYWLTKKRLKAINRFK